MHKKSTGPIPENMYKQTTKIVAYLRSKKMFAIR